MVRRRLGLRSVGHTGTLDPFATGLLVVLVGRATRLARFLGDGPKEYRATVRFGSATDTDDGTGKVIREMRPPEWPARAAVAASMQAMVGRHPQRPPAYSAKHVAGERSHAMAREGRAVDLAPVEVMVHALELTTWSPPDLELTATVGSGTYIRALARDLGERLGLPAHCAELRRTRIGAFDVADAVAPEEATAERLLAPSELMRHLPARALSDQECREVGFGRDVSREPGDAALAALVGPDGRLVAVAEADDRHWHPAVVLETGA